MIHYRPPQGPSSENGVPAEGSSRHREQFAALEASLSQLRRAKRAAGESLRRVQDAPEPHETTNTIFVALWEAHLRDREALFTAMRQFEDAREALRRIATGMGAGDGSPDRRRAG